MNNSQNQIGSQMQIKLKLSQFHKTETGVGPGFRDRMLTVKKNNFWLKNINFSKDYIFARTPKRPTILQNPPQANFRPTET